MGRTLSPDELVSGFIPTVGTEEARPQKPRSRVRYAESFNFISGMFYGDPINYRKSKTIEIEIPDDTPRRHYNDGINYHDDRPLIAANEFTVPDSELVAFNDVSADAVEHFKDVMYSGAATLSAMDTASDYVGAALNDGLDLGIEMDERPFAAFVHLSRLEILSAAVARMKITDQQKKQLLAHLTKSLAEKAVDAMTIADNTEKQRRLITERYHAVVQPSSGESDVGEQRKLGVKRSRL